MKKKTILMIITILTLIVSLTEKTYAISIPIDNYELIPNGVYYDCTSSGCSSVSTTSDGYETNNNYYPMLVNSSTLTIASNGVAFTYQPYETLKSGYLYNITTYYCSNKDIGATTKTQFLGQANTTAVSTNYATTNSQSIADVGPFNYCYEIQSLISPKSNTRYISYKMTNSSSISGVYLYSIGFKIKELGVYTSEIQTIIESALSSATSGLATSNQLNSAVANIESNANTNSQNEINNANTNSQNQIESQNVCYKLDEKYAKNRGYLGPQGAFVEQEATNYVSDYIALNSQSKLTLLKQGITSLRLCFYDSSKTYISCIFNGDLTEGQNITIPTNAKYLRFTMKTNDSQYGPNYQLCSNGNQAFYDTMSQDHEYNTNESQSTQSQKQEMDDFEQQENTLRNNLNLDIEDAEITINPEASSFIWEVINRLRGMSGKIVLLFTSILSLGIMKMILGR